MTSIARPKELKLSNRHGYCNVSSVSGDVIIACVEISNCGRSSVEVGVLLLVKFVEYLVEL